MARFVGPCATTFPPHAPADLADLLAPPGTLPVPPARDREVWTTRDPDTIAPLAARARADLTAPWPAAPASAAARLHRDGDRDGYEQRVFARQRRLSRAAVLAATTGEATWLDEVLDGVVLLCEQSSWCWPAHDDAHARRGWVLPDVERPYLDLGAGEVVGQLAWIDHLLGPELDAHAPGLRARVRSEARLRVVEPFVRRRDWHWIGLAGDAHNWNPWIHGNVLLAALQLVEDRAECAELVALVIEGLDRYVATLPADGAIDEGYAYWWNGACRALEALDLLRHATGGALDASGVPALRATVSFPARMQLGGPWYLNLADGPARPPAAQSWDAVHRAARRSGDDLALAHAASHRRPGAPLADETQGLGRLLRALTDEAWIAAAPAPAPLPRESWFPSTQVLVARSTAGSAAGLTLAVKGGHNGEHHNHNDVGSVVVALAGVPVVADAGRPTYTARTFGPERYDIWTMQSDWHTVPAVRGTAQAAGAGYAARDVHVAPGELRLDLAGAYPRTDVRRWERTARLDRSGVVTITDAWELAPDPDAPDSQVRLLLAGEVTVGPGTARVRALEGAGTVELTWEPAAAATLDERAPDDPMLAFWGERLTRLSLAAPGASGRLVVTIREVS